jgi:hypothetical protein
MLGRHFHREVALQEALPLLGSLLGDEYVVRPRERGMASFWNIRGWLGFKDPVIIDLHVERREASSEDNVRIQRLRMDPSEGNDSNLLSVLTVNCDHLEIVHRDEVGLEPTGIAALFQRLGNQPRVFTKKYQFSHTNFCAYLEAVTNYHSLNAVSVAGEDDVAGRVAIQRVRGKNIHAVSQTYNQYIGGIVRCFGLHSFRNFSEPFQVAQAAQVGPRIRPVMGPLEGGLQNRPRVAYTPNPFDYSGAKLPRDEILAQQERNFKAKSGTYVHKIKAAASLEVSKNTPVGIAPLGTPVVDGLECGPGFFAENSSRELLKAFLARIIVRDPPFQTLPSFQRFCRAMNDRLLSQVGDRIAQLGPEPEVEATYRAVMKGKKSEEEISRRLDLYKRGVAGQLCGRELNKFLHCGVFLKFENNAKTRDALNAAGVKFRVTGGKPRIICTMGIREEVETAAVLEALNVLLHSDLGDHMVCGLTVEQLAAVIDDATLADHTTTDFSSWESSARREIVTDCECAIILDILERAGWYNLRRSMARTFEQSQRKVHSKNVTLVIDGRHSGKFITYFANCLLNMYNIWWNAFVSWAGQRDLDSVMDEYFRANTSIARGVQIVSGDDGIVPSNTVSPTVSADLGFDLGVNVRAVETAVAPFCSTYAKAGKLYGNVASVVLKLLWVKRGLDLRPQKQMFLMRMAAYSAWLKYGDHPVIGALVVAIGRVTAGVSPFKGWKRFTDYWKGDYPDEHAVIKDFPREWKGCSEERRSVVERGGIDRVGVPVSVQFALERDVLQLDWSKFCLLEDDEVVLQAVHAGAFVDGNDCHAVHRADPSQLDDVRAIFRALGSEMAEPPRIHAAVPAWDGVVRVPEFSKLF